MPRRKRGVGEVRVASRCLRNSRLDSTVLRVAKERVRMEGDRRVTRMHSGEDRLAQGMEGRSKGWGWAEALG